MLDYLAVCYLELRLLKNNNQILTFVKKKVKFTSSLNKNKNYSIKENFSRP